MVRAKFRVVRHIKDMYNTSATTVVLDAQYDDGTPENARYAKATPNGRIEMTIDNPPALEQFPLGSVHYVDFNVAG